MPGRRLNYTSEDYFNLFIIYGECNKVISRTCDTFAARYPEKQKPSRDSVRRMVETFKTQGSVRKNLNRRKHIVDDENFEVVILGYFNAFPTMSVRQAALESGLSKSSILRILKKHKFRPYSMNMVQHLNEPDYLKRIQFCEFLLLKYQEDPSFLDNVIWSDESKFTKNGLHNRHNSHYWSDRNPHITRDRNYQGGWQFNVYCAIRNNQIVALQFYEENLNGERYLNILRNLDTNYLENINLEDHRKLFYQHDGAPPHNSFIVNEYLQQTFQDQWIANDGPFMWPPRSPDLSVLDFFIWGTIKNLVYKVPLTTKEDCMERVRRAFQDLSPLSIRRATHEALLLRCEKCLEVQGQNFEHIL